MDLCMCYTGPFGKYTPYNILLKIGNFGYLKNSLSRNHCAKNARHGQCFISHRYLSFVLAVFSAAVLSILLIELTPTNLDSMFSSSLLPSSSPSFRLTLPFPLYFFLAKTGFCCVRCRWVIGGCVSLTTDINIVFSREKRGSIIIKISLQGHLFICSVCLLEIKIIGNWRKHWHGKNSETRTRNGMCFSRVTSFRFKTIDWAAISASPYCQFAEINT